MYAARTSWVAIIALLLTGCEKGQEGPYRAPTVELLTDVGYTYANDTAGTSDTLTVALRVAKGTEDADAIVVRVAYDGDDPVTTDDIDWSGDTITFVKQVVTRDQAGIEDWDFGVRLKGGDLYFRPVLLTVQ